MGKNDRDINKYKRDLEKLFSNDSQVPDRFKDVVGDLAPEEGSDEALWREQVQILRDTEGFREFVAAANAFRAEGHRWPDDEDLLIRVLDHPDERVLRDVMEHVADLHRRKTVARKRPILNRVSTIKTMSEDPRTLRLVRELEELLA